MRAAFDNALFCERPTILGRRLMPLSIGHVSILQAIESPLTSGGVIHEHDIAAAIAICSKRFVDLCDVFCPKMFDDDILEYAKLSEEERAKASFDFFRYFREQTNAPKHWQSKGSGGTSNCPWLWHLVRIMCQHYNMTPDAAWEIPFSRAICHYEAWAESQGDDSLVTDKQVALAPWILKEG
jgi:hypothetical protein